MSSATSEPSREAFAALGSEVRLEVLRTLAAAMESGADSLTFTEVYESLDLDSTSQLAYHLSELTGRFVRQSDDEYELTQAGDRVVRAVRAGSYSDQPSFEPTAVDGSCPRCGPAALVAAYGDAGLTVSCESCDARVVTFDLPPAAVAGRTNREALAACNRRAHADFAAALDGVCSTCGGRTALDVRSTERGDPLCVSECRQCGLRLFAPFETRLLYHAGVVSFFWERGVDVSTLPLWELPAFVADWTVGDVDGGFPVDVVVRCGEDSLETVVADDMSVSVVS